VIFIVINADKIINAFTKIFCVNVVNVYHIDGPTASEMSAGTPYKLPFNGLLA